MIAGTLELQLQANMARLSADMDQAKRSVGGAMAAVESSVAMAKGALIGLGAVGLASAFAGSLKAAIDQADAINKLSQRYGVSAEAISQWQYAAKLADVSTESLATVFKKLNVSISSGIAGDKEKLATFQALGVTLTDTSGKVKSADAVLLDLSDAFSKSKDGAGKTDAALKLMGKAGDEMIPLLNGGRQAIVDLMTEADKLGLTISSDFAERAEEFNDNLTRIQTSTQRLTIALADDLVSGLGRAMKAMADAAVQGGVLHGVIAGIQTLLTGDDLHKANVATVNGTELVMAAENALSAARSKNDAPRIARLEKALELRKQELATDNNYRKLLESDQDKAKAAADKLKAPRTSGPEIKMPKSGGGSSKDSTSKGDAYLKSLQSQLDKTRQLTAVESVQADLKNGHLATMTAGQLKQVMAVAEMIDAEKAAMAISKERADAKNREYEQSIQAARENAQFERDRLKSLTDRGPTAQLEAQRREMMYLAEALEAGKISAEEFNDAATGALGLDQKQDSPLAAYFKSLETPVADMEAATVRAFGNMEDALVNFATTGKLDFKSLANSIIADLIRIQIRSAMSSVLGGSGGGGLGGIFGSVVSLFTGGAAASAGGFGSGADFGSADLGLSFDGGGYTGGGSRSGGMDGKGGFPAMLHPQETIVDHSKGQSLGSSSSATINNTYSIQIDSRADAGAVFAGVQSMLKRNNETQNEQLRRAGVLA